MTSQRKDSLSPREMSAGMGILLFLLGLVVAPMAVVGILNDAFRLNLGFVWSTAVSVAAGALYIFVIWRIALALSKRRHG